MITEFTSADELACDHDKAVAYLTPRQTDLEKFMKSMKWEVRNTFSIQADVYGNQIVHELKPRQLHSFPVWGELFWKPGASKIEEPVIFHSFENFAAFVMAKWW